MSKPRTPERLELKSQALKRVVAALRATRHRLWAYCQRNSDGSFWGNGRLRSYPPTTLQKHLTAKNYAPIKSTTLATVSSLMIPLV